MELASAFGEMPKRTLSTWPHTALNPSRVRRMKKDAQIVKMLNHEIKVQDENKNDALRFNSSPSPRQLRRQRSRRGRDFSLTLSKTVMDLAPAKPITISCTMSVQEAARKMSIYRNFVYRLYALDSFGWKVRCALIQLR
mmetsp:Transcript_5262/g.10407  ORF Transcript_5262/g.10407 Transcript_5262/m.10407 type:complete len:139 (+) Transcript_5262:48-464(+)